MGIATAFSAARMLAIEQASVIGGAISGDNLILTTKGGVDFVAGNVRGPVGPRGDGGNRWAYNANYITNDVVGYAGRVWKAKAGNSNKPPALYSSLWQPLHGGDFTAWALDDPYFMGEDFATNFQLFWGSGGPSYSFTSVAGEFETGTKAMKVTLPAAAGQRIYQNDENIVRGGEWVTVEVRARRSSGAAGGTLDVSLEQNLAGRPEPFEGSSSVAGGGSKNVTATWATYTFSMLAIAGKPRAKVHVIVSNYAGAACEVVIDRIEIKRQTTLPDVDWFVPTLQNGYANLDATSFDPFGVCRLNGATHLRGMIAGGTRTSGTLIFTLPPGFRPGGTTLDVRTHQAVTAGSTVPDGGQHRINIATLSGLVTVNVFNTAGGWVSLTGINFPAGA